MSTSKSSQATIQGDSSSPGLLSVTSPFKRVISLRLSNLIITNFGTDSRFDSCLSLSDLALVIFTHVTMVSISAGSNWLLRIMNCDSVALENFVLANNTCSSFSQRGLVSINMTDSVSFSGCAVRNNVGGMNSVHNHVVVVAKVRNLMLSTTTVSSNMVQQGMVFWIDNIDKTVVTGSHFSNNAGGFAGALYINNASDVAVTGTTFKNNKAAASGGVGGAVFLDGSKIESYVTFTNCNFSRNFAHDGGGAISIKGAMSTYLDSLFEGNSGTRGGALYSDSTMIVDSCMFHSNTAQVVKFDGDPAYFAPVGGAIFNDQGDNSRIARSSFIKNTAAANGGAIKAAAVNNYSIVECCFTSNYAGGYGGGVSVESESSGVTIEDTNLTRNAAQTHGGGLYFSPSNTFISIIYSMFSQNKAIEGSGGGIHFTGSCSKISIGGPSPQTLSMHTTNATVVDSNYTGLNYAGFVDIPNVAGYYVMFDVTTALNGDGYYNGIEISGNSGLAYQGRQFWQYQYKTNPSIYFYDDILTWPGIAGNSPLFVSGQRLTYKIHEEGDHYYFTVYPILKKQRSTTFSGNTAYLNGGAIYWGNANTDIFVMSGTVFNNNSATSAEGSGGAIHMQISNGLIHMFSATFEGNTANTGGAITVSQSNYPMSVYSCNFTNNRATGQGGAMYLGVGNGFGVVQVLTSNAIRFLDTLFSGNTATLSGGGVYVSKVNALTFNNTLMTGNFANSTGGALHFEFQNICQMNHTTSSLNAAAGCGGAVQSSSGNNILFDKQTTFTENYAAYDGGAVSMLQASVVSFRGNTDFLGNIAGEYGGAIRSGASFLTLGAAGILFQGNMASQGSAMRLESLTTGSLSISSSNSTSITYTDNRCSGRGGTVSWTKDPAADAGTYSAYDIINFNRIIYSNNSAIFGSNTSTQATSLVFAGGNLSLVNDYYSVLMPHPTVHLLDYFSAKDVSDSSALVTATVVTSSCLGHVGYLSGITTATSSLGDAVFTGLTAFCYPGGHMTLKYTGKKHRFTTVPRIMTRSRLIVPLYHCEHVNCPKLYSTLTLPFSPASRSGHSLQHRDAELLRVPTVR
jgi:predicted outer membrane repeat protein